MINEQLKEYNLLQEEYNQLRSLKFEVMNERNTLLGQLKEHGNFIENLRKEFDALEQYFYEKLASLNINSDEFNNTSNEVYDTFYDIKVAFFRLKEISAASKSLTYNISVFNDRYYYYNDIRRITTSIVFGYQFDMCSNKQTLNIVNENHNESNNYWLSYALHSVIHWIVDDEKQAKLSLAKSLDSNLNKSSAFYLFLNIRFEREKIAKQWCLFYVDNIDLKTSPKSLYNVLMIYLGNCFEDDDFQSILKKKINIVFEKFFESDPSLAKKIETAAYQSLQQHSYRTNFNFNTLIEVYDNYQGLIENLNHIEKNQILYNQYLDLLLTEGFEDINYHEIYDNIFHGLINSTQKDEEMLLKKITYSKAIINMQGDLIKSKIEYEKSYPKKSNFTVSEYLLHMLFHHQRTMEERAIKLFLIREMKEYILKGVKRYHEESYQEMQTNYNFKLEDFTLKYDSSNEKANRNQFHKYFKTLKKQSNQQINKTLFILYNIFLFTIFFHIKDMLGFTTALFLVIAMVVFGTYIYHYFSKKYNRPFKEKRDDVLKKYHDSIEELQIYEQRLNESSKFIQLLVDLIESL